MNEWMIHLLFCSNRLVGEISTWLTRRSDRNISKLGPQLFHITLPPTESLNTHNSQYIAPLIQCTPNHIIAVATELRKRNYILKSEKNCITKWCEEGKTLRDSLTDSRSRIFFWKSSSASSPSVDSFDRRFRFVIFRPRVSFSLSIDPTSNAPSSLLFSFFPIGWRRERRSD